MIKTGFNGYMCDFSTDYHAVTGDNIKDIHKHLVRKNNIVWYAQKLKQYLQN